MHSILSSPGNAVAPKLVAATNGVLGEIRNVSASEQDLVGLPSSVPAPLVARGEPGLHLEGRPAALYIGAEFCPYCAALRWAIVMAFDRFGAFSGLQETTSSPWDAYPSTPTFSFYRSRYVSRYISLVAIEREGNDTHGLGTRSNLAPVTALESGLWSRFDTHFGQSLSFPFLDVGNEVFVLGSSFDPGVLAGLDQKEVAADLLRPSSLVARDIIGTSNYLTAGICRVTHGLPGDVCSVAAVRSAAALLKLG